MSNFKIITNLRTNESGEDDLSFDWIKEEIFPPYAGSPLTDISLDQLERFSFAKKIARAISKRKNEGSIVIGLHGTPGEGKTTVLNFLGYELAKFQNITYLRFNPSRAVNSSSLVQSFFEAFSEVIETSDEISGSMRKKIARMLSAYSSFLAPGGGAEQEEKKKRRLFSKTPLELKKGLETSFRKLERKIVFLIDDLDKIELNEVRTFLRLVRLSVNFPNTAFVLSFDEESLSMQLGGRTKGGSSGSGMKILQKAVHLRLAIPPAGKARLLEMCFGGISEIFTAISGEEDPVLGPSRMKDFKRTFQRAFSPALKTPRQCNMYLNALTSSLPEKAEGLDRRYFMLVEALRVFYPAFYETIRNNSEAFIGVEFNESPRSEVEENISHFAVKKVLENLPSNEKEALRWLLSHLFPCLQSSIQGFGSGDYPLRNPWIEEKPVASKQYFSRYFLLNTSGTDDFQRDADRLLLKSATGSIGDLALSIRKLVRQAGTDAFIQAIENRIDEISPVSAGNLIRAFGQTGGSFLNPDTLFSFVTVYAHPAILVRKLLLNIDDVHDRFSIAAFLMKESEPVSFAFECLRWIGTDKTQERIFPNEVEDELKRILTERIRSLAYRYPLYLTMPEETPLIMSVWSFLGSKEETTRYLESTFRQEPANVVEFLKCYLPDEWLDDGRSELSGSFMLNLNSSVSGLIDSKVLYKQLEKSHASIQALSADESSLSRRMLRGLTGISAQGADAGKIPAKELKVFHINDYEKQKQKNLPENNIPNEDPKRSSLTQVSKGLYRPLFDLFN